jgi:hypothetical protein
MPAASPARRAAGICIIADSGEVRHGGCSGHPRFSCRTRCVLFVAERWKPEAINALEENFIAILLAAITIISFFPGRRPLRLQYRLGRRAGTDPHPVRLDDPVRHVYGVKQGMHLGVDA